ncbi:uncharacterized protein (DUF952 family) [Modestobacter roseus]|uniref:Uncharacterized protein (DUF952 family) n=1 Tax=Modestobacter roseus TaxID=1181884 RepID=A0A562IT01_9ACTN|nr:uncharacterized protein (DUF952 family) [Modestobacter roseus]
MLLHLIEPAAWRAALDTGVVEPPSLAGAGFVHLSTPDQVHLPARRLYGDRRDVVVLVVDPARLTDPVRWEPGVPGDPSAMRFPHLFGPLPTAAVVGVVPWLRGRPLALPDPGDAAARARALAVSVATRRAAQLRPVPGGLVVSEPAFPHSRDDNRVLVTGAVTAAAVAELTAAAATDAAWPAQAATLLHPAAGPVAQELARRGWDVSPTVAMARRAPFPERPPGSVEAVPQERVHEFWAQSWRRELAGADPPLAEVVAQLVGREHRTDRVVQVTDLVVRESGRVVAAAQLRVDGATAAVDSVLTDPAARRRGHADALLTAALHRAGRAGCDLVVLDAAAEDWPRQWYARRGFDVVGRSWEAVRA